MSVVERCQHDMVVEFCSNCRGVGTERAVETSTYHWDSRHPDIPEETLASWIVEELRERDRDDLLRRLLVEKLSEHRRRRVRLAEERAERERRSVRQGSQSSGEPSRDLAVRREERQREDARRAKEPWKAPSHSKHYKAWQRLPPERQVQRRAEQDEVYASFLADESWTGGRDGEAAFAAWRMQRYLYEFTERAREEARLELTAELLGSRFALGDGTSVTWGEATAQQHEQRFTMLMGQAEGTVDAAKRHQAAISLLAAGGARCLNDVQVAA